MLPTVETLFLVRRIFHRLSLLYKETEECPLDD